LQNEIQRNFQKQIELEDGKNLIIEKL
jgi:hypothetical protein